MNTTSFSGVGKVATLTPDVPVGRLEISHGEIQDTCKSQIQQPGRSTLLLLLSL